MTLLRVKVKPNARRDTLILQADGSWVASVVAPPLEGAANAAVIALVAAHFDVVKRRVSIKSGASSRHKRVQITDL